MDAEVNALLILMLLVVVSLFFGLWLAGSAYEIHRHLYLNMMVMLQANYHWCMVAHTYDNKYPECLTQFDTGFKGMYVGWRESYIIAFDNNWFVKGFRWGFFRPDT